MNKFGSSLIAVCVLATIACPALPGTTVNDNLPSRADSLYLGGEYMEAASEYLKAAGASSGTDRIRFNFLAAKAFYRAENYQASGEMFSDILSEDPPGYIQAASLFYLGNMEFRNDDFLAAARHYAAAYQSDWSDDRRRIYLESLRPLISNHLQSTQSEQLIQTVSDSELKSELFCSLSEKYFDEHRYQVLIDQIDRYLIASTTPPCEERLASLQEQAHSRLDNIPRVAILVPRDGALAEYGTAVIEGAKLAFEDYQERSGREVMTTIVNTEARPISAAAKLARLKDQSFSVVLGPLTSVVAPVVISQTACRGIPVVSPTASELGLAGIEDNFFQLTPSTGSLATRLGQYISENLTLDSVAIIYPNDPNGREAYNEFKQIAEDRETEVFFERSFPPNSADFRDLLLDLKQTVLPDTFDTTIFINEKGDTLETEEVPISIRAIYIPASEAQLELIVPQIHFYKIHTTFLGGGSWGSERIRRLSALETRDVIFADDLMLLPDDRDYVYFYNRYQRRFDHPPELIAARAFDAATLICDAFEAAGTTPEAVWNYLASGIVVEGVAGRIRFNEQNENQEVSIYWLSEGEITREE